MNINREDFDNYEDYKIAQEDYCEEMEYYAKEDREEATRKVMQDFKSMSFIGTEFLNNE